MAVLDWDGIEAEKAEEAHMPPSLSTEKDVLIGQVSSYGQIALTITREFYLPEAPIITQGSH